MWNLYKTKGNASLKFLLLLFAFMMFMSSSAGISYIILVFSVLALFIVPIFNNIDKTGMWILLFSVAYSIMLLLNGNYGRVPIFLLSPIVFYSFGKYLTSKIDNQALIDFFAITVVLFALRVYIACIIDINEVGLINPYRAMNRSGVGDSDMAATLFGLNVSLGFVGLVPFFIRDNKKRFPLLLLFVAFLLSLLTVLHLTNRTGLMVSLVCATVSILYLNPTKNGRVFFILLFLGIVIFVIARSANVLVSDFAESYNQREEISESGFSTMGGRLYRWVDATRRLFTDPFGFDGKTKYTFAHNLWLDAARVAGTIPFIFLVVATIKGYKHVRQLWKIKNDCVILLLVALSFATFSSAFVEPVLEGSDIYFYIMCLIWGIACQYNKKLLST